MSAMVSILHFSKTGSLIHYGQLSVTVGMLQSIAALAFEWTALLSQPAAWCQFVTNTPPAAGQLRAAAVPGPRMDVARVAGSLIKASLPFDHQVTVSGVKM